MTQRIEGEAAKGYVAVRIDSYAAVNHGELISADEETGEVVYKDTPESTKSVTLGPHMVRILPRYPR